MQIFQSRFVKLIPRIGHVFAHSSRFNIFHQSLDYSKHAAVKPYPTEFNVGLITVHPPVSVEHKIGLPQ